MLEYDRSITMHKEPPKVFAFASEVSPLPKYMPTVNEFLPQSGENHHAHANTAEHHYEFEGFFRLESDEYRVD